MERLREHSKASSALAFLAVAAGLIAISCNRNGNPAPDSQRASVAPAARSATVAATNINGMAMIRLPAGEFIMGDDNGDTDEKPAHKVQLSSFLIDAREVSQASYEALMEKNPSKFKGADRPVDQVDWYHAVLYCNMRSRKEGLKPCYDSKTLACDFTADGYRLPTEAEWEYACRAGTRDSYSTGPDAAKLKTCAWFKENSGQSTHPVAQKAPNLWGLYDIHGNVAEWCQDIYAESYGPQKEIKDPKGPDTGDKRVLRGGSWSTSADACRCSARNSETPRLADACFGSDTYGFRCVRRSP